MKGIEEIICIERECKMVLLTLNYSIFMDG